MKHWGRQKRKNHGNRNQREAGSGKGTPGVGGQKMGMKQCKAWEILPPPAPSAAGSCQGESVDAKGEVKGQGSPLPHRCAHRRALGDLGLCSQVPW